MVAVFSIFATLSVIEFKMFGIGMASAVLIDATIVRGVLMPAVMSLLSERNWYLPTWLRRRGDVVPAQAPEIAAPAWAAAKPEVSRSSG
jgi:RND superfamily putative drug exporter